jgi:N-acetylmuramoyl-L-alanine amidase
MRFPRLALGLATSALVLGTAVPAGAQTYRVEPGDALSTIAASHGVRLDALVAANGITDPNRIRVGQQLVIPPRPGSPARVATPAATTPAATATTYQVRAGDTLGVIASRHRVTVGALASANNLSNPNRIRVGQLLQIPGASGGAPAATPAPSAPAAPKTAPAAPATTYEVRSGDVLSTIARRLGTSVTELVRINALTDPNRIRVGQVLQVPATGRAQTPPPAQPTTPPAPPSAPTPPPASDSGPAPATPTNRYPGLPARLVNSSERMTLIPSFERWATHYGIDVEWLMAVAWLESGWQRTVVSSKGAVGIGQLMPGTSQWLATQVIRIPSLDPWNADDNIRMSAAFLAWLQRHMGSRDLAIAAYYQGPNSVQRNGLFRVTETYLANVNSLIPVFRPA